MRTSASDDVLETLFQPLSDGLLAWPPAGRVLFLRAHSGLRLREAAQTASMICEQEFKPAFDELLADGLEAVELDSLPADLRFALVLVLPPRQRDESRALYAQALARCAPGGRVLACLRNDEGARSGEADLARLAGPVASLSRRKCRAFWTSPLQQPADTALAHEWAALDAPRAILDGRYISRPGVFAWDRVDPASALLTAHLPADLAGYAADLGAGYGYLSRELLARCPQIVGIDLYEAQARALAMSRLNLQFPDKVLQFFWHDVSGGLLRRYDVIVSNPPFHAQGREERPDLGRRFIREAARALQPGGCFWMVANRHLPYEQALEQHFGDVRTVAQENGFKVIEARNPRSLA